LFRSNSENNYKIIKLFVHIQIADRQMIRILRQIKTNKTMITAMVIEIIRIQRNALFLLFEHSNNVLK
jgi:hypothetical protein